jgi:hypothetical protein
VLENPRQAILALVAGVGLLAVIIELVRRRKLKEEYAWLWIAAGVAILIVGVSYDLLLGLTRLIGAGYTSSTLFFFGLFFVIALCLQFSVKISRLETQLKNLSQEMAILAAQKGDAEDEESRIKA